jgi:predicted ATPase/DNA-binding winged helix-turn-helix (wHTH) protein
MDVSAISFGPFRLVAAERLLLEGDKPVRLGSRAFDILAALVERAGQVVGKEELIARAWPQTFVEEANLKIQVSALRRALGDGQNGHRFVVTVPGRGYNFVAPVSLDGPSRAPLRPTTTPAGVHNLPLAVTRMVGREEAVAALVSRLSRQRLVTIVGPGGIGKTTVALAVAERMIPSYEHGVWLVDLAPLGDPRLVPSAVANVLDVEIRTDDPLPGLTASLTDKRMLLLLDNCEHVIDAAASLAAAVLSGAPSVSMLATSREPLGISGEREYRLGPLSSPQSSYNLTATEAATFPAVQLFVERVTATVEDFALIDANAPLVVEICRRLDGLPLAIEFAAPRVEVLGVEGLAARMGDSLLLLQGRRRRALPRHRTMRAVIDWSYGLLSEDEQLFFRALGIFSGGFTVEAAAAVAVDAARTQVVAIDRLADLVAKSLVVADVGGAKPRFRLLDTTRGYAIEKLDESGERDRIAHRHAAYYRDLFERAEGEVTAGSTREWLVDYAREIDNLRAALDWAFSPGGEIPIGVALTAAAAPLWMRLWLPKECYSRAKQALGAIGTGGPRAEMRLHAALGTCLLFAGGGVGPETGPALTRALEIAESLEDAEYQLRSIWGLWALHNMTSQFRVALETAQRFRTLAAKQHEGNDQLIGDRMIGLTLHFLGDQTRARRHVEHILAHRVAPVERPDFIPFGIHHGVAAHVCLARVLWLQGFPDEAMRTARSVVEEARETNHALSLTYALAHGACPIMLWVEDLAAAERYITTLLDHSTRHALPLWCAMGRAFQGILVIRRGELGPGLRLLRAGFDQFGGIGWISSMFSSELAASFGRAGQTADGLAAAEQAIEQAEQTEGRWALPESLRIKGELLLLQAADGATAAADDHFRQAVDWARRQGELSWELRAATSLARLLRIQGRLADAIACLQPIYNRFTEGFDTADLIVAKRLLDELGNAGSE